MISAPRIIKVTVSGAHPLVTILIMFNVSGFAPYGTIPPFPFLLLSVHRVLKLFRRDRPQAVVVRESWSYLIPVYN